MRIQLSMALVVFSAGVLPALAGEDAKTISLADAPAAVQATIKDHVADGALGEIDRTNEEGEVVYEVTFTPKGGEERDFDVADDGTLLSVEMLLPEVPAPVRKTIEVEANGWALDNIDKNVSDTEITFDVDVSTNADGGTREKNFTVAENGDLLSLSMALTNVPAVVQATIQAQAGGGMVASLEETFDPDGNQFDVEVASGGGAKKCFTVTEDGKMYSEEVSLEKVPPGARKTITEKIGNGKLLRIEKALLEKKDGVLPYEVESRKDGQEFDFSVGPKGRFFGEDE